MLLELPVFSDLSPAEMPGCVRRVHDTYIGLDRPRLGADTLLDFKFSAAFWRARFLSDLADAVPNWSPEECKGLVPVLEALRVYIPDPLRARFAEHIPDPIEAARLWAVQGSRSEGVPRMDLNAGPDLDLDIRVNRSSPWSFEKWGKNPVFSNYDFTADGGVRYRGVEWQAGDMLVANVNLDGNGLYTALADPKSFCSHSALFAILDHAGRRFPAVIETFEKGVRAVPLSVFLNPRFSAYTEVLRHRDMDDAQRQRVNTLAREATAKVKGYNFDTEDPEQDYMSCTSVARFILEDAGLPRIETKSYLRHPRIQRNLRRIGYDYWTFFAPVDYLLEPKLRCVGWVDNNQFDWLLSRELVETRFRDLMSTRVIEPRRFPFPYRFNRWGIGQLRHRTWIGKAISIVEGFDHVSLPKGPDPVMAVITLAEAQLGKAIKRTHPFVVDYLAGLSEFDRGAVLGDAEVRRVLVNNLRLPWLHESAG